MDNYLAEEWVGEELESKTFVLDSYFVVHYTE